jgi:acyl-coenzyme A synthetase/AMP-(fatty) acid ligase
MATIVFQEGPKAPKPTVCKKQLLNHIVDGMAVSRPQALYAEYPTSSESYSAGFTKLTYGAFANAINGLAWWLEHHLGHGSDFETLTYFGPNDFRQNALVLAACKAGYKVSTLHSEVQPEALLTNSRSSFFSAPLATPWRATRTCSAH